MKTSTPEQFSLTFQPLLRQGRIFCAFTAGTGFHLLDGSSIAASEIMGIALRALPEGAILDSGVPKKRPEWLAAGAACAPAGTQLSRQLVDICVGATARRFLAGDGKTPFSTLPLIWENTWGAPDSPCNPLGCGLKPDPATGAVRMPLVTDSEEAHGTPACPVSLGAWPCRTRLLGTYDAHWLKTRWPAFPDDMNWEFFNLAQERQRFSVPLRGGEPYRIAGMHPEHPVISGTLPLPEPRLEVLRAGRDAWEPVPIVADTLWLFPGETAGMILWHGETPCADEAATDILHARLRIPEQTPDAPPEHAAPATAAAGAGAAAAGMAATAAGAGTAANAGPEARNSAALKQEEPVRPASETARADADAAATAATEMHTLFRSELDAINEALVQQGFPPLNAEQQADISRRIDAGSRQISEMLSQMDAPHPDLDAVLTERGLPPEQQAALHSALALPIPNPGDFSDGTAWQAAATAHLAQVGALLHPAPDVEERAAKLIALMASSMNGVSPLEDAQPPSLASLLTEKGLPAGQAAALAQALEQPVPTDQGFTGLTAYGNMVERQAGLPAGSIAGHLQKMHDFLVQQGLMEPEPAMSNPASIPPMPMQARAEERPPVRNSTAPSAAPAPEASASPDRTPHAAEDAPTPTEEDASRADALRLAGILAAGGTLAGASLAGMRLDHVDFGGCDLHGADLTGADIRASNFSGCDLRGAILVRAQAGGSQWVHAQLDGAIMDGMLAPDADFRQASLAGASAAEADFTGADFTRAVLRDMRAPRSRCGQACFFGADCTGIMLRGAMLQRADADAADFTGADLAESVCHGMSMNEASRLCHANCNGASLTDCSWDGVRCTGGSFAHACLDGARMEDCDLGGCCLAAASARGASLARSRLDGADMRGMNLFQASLREARAEGADCSFASLYGADLHRFATGQRLRAESADFTCTIIDARNRA